MLNQVLRIFDKFSRFLGGVVFGLAWLYLTYKVLCFLHFLYKCILINWKSMTVASRKEACLGVHSSDYVHHECVTRTITFRLKAKDASIIFVTGSFLNWETLLPMKKKNDSDEWTLRVQVPIGHHQYRFVKDGRWTVNDDKRIWADENGYLHNVLHVVANELKWVKLARKTKLSMDQQADSASRETSNIKQFDGKFKTFVF